MAAQLSPQQQHGSWGHSLSVELGERPVSHLLLPLVGGVRVRVRALTA